MNDDPNKKLLDELKKEIKCLALTYTNGASAHQLASDFKEFNGKEIPFARFGFSNLQSFISSLRDTVVKKTSKRGHVVYFAASDKDLNHLEDLIQNQRKPGSRPKYTHDKNFCSHDGPKPPKPVHSKRDQRINLGPLPIISNWNNQIWAQPIDLTQFQFNQEFLSRFNITPNLPNNTQQKPDLTKIVRTVTNDRTSVKLTPPSRNPIKGDIRDFTGPPTNQRAQVPFLSSHHRSRIRKLLSRFPEGITLEVNRSFKFYYQAEFKEDFDEKTFGFKNILDCLKSIPDICTLTLKDKNSTSYIAKLTPTAKEYLEKQGPVTEKGRIRKIKEYCLNNSSSEESSKSSQDSRSDSEDKMDQVRQTTPTELDDTDNLPPKVIEVFKEILQAYPSGIKVSDFEEEYNKKFGCFLDPSTWGYLSLIEMFYTLQTIFFVVPAEYLESYGNEAEALLFQPELVPEKIKQWVNNYNLKNGVFMNTRTMDWAIKERIMKLLIKHGKMLLVNFMNKYFTDWNESLEPTRYGFEDAVKMFETLSEEMPIVISQTFSGQFYQIELTTEYAVQWIKLCIDKNQLQSLRIVKHLCPDDVMLPGDEISAIAVSQDDLDSGKLFKAYVTAASNPYSIWINLCGPSHSIVQDTMMGELQTFAPLMELNNTSLRIPEYLLCPGLYATALYGGNQWHRVLINGYDQQKKLCRISYVDYGGGSSIPANSLRFLKSSLAKYPIAAIKLSLEGIKPVNSVWTERCKEFILNICSDDIVQVKFLRVEQIIKRAGMPFNKYAAQIYLKDGKDITQLLIDEGCAVRINPCPSESDDDSLQDNSSTFQNGNLNPIEPYHTLPPKTLENLTSNMSNLNMSVST